MSVETSRAPNFSSPKLNGGSNGVSPSYNRASSSMTLPSKPNRRISSMNSSQILARNHGSHSHGGAASYKLSFVSETASTLKRRSHAELGAGISKSIIDTSFIDFIGVIRTERLTTLPHKGSRWDKVLIKAQYFAELLNNYDTAIRGYALDSTTAAAVGYGHARLLIELGHEHSQAMDKVFSFYYKLSLQISVLVSRADLLAATPEIREELCLMFTDLLSLVTEVSIRLYKQVKVVTSRTSLDLYEVFGETIQTINARCAKVTQEIWSFQIDNEGFESEEVVQIDVLKRWLGVQDHVLASLSRDHTTFADHQAEFTGLWFQKHLSRFIQGQGNVFLVNGEPGSGKTVLAASIADRLQRPVARKSFSTVFCSISSGIPTQATSINVVKSLLYQLLDIRVGNVTIYEAVANAYRHSRNSDNASTYEEYLWSALSDALKHPIESANDLVLVVDGLDELSGGSTAAQKLFERLVEVTNQGKNVKLISLSESVRAPANVHITQLDVTPDDIADDVREVVLKALRDYRYFNTRDAGEQDSILERIALVAKGSFVWAILACDVLELEKDAAAFDRTLSQFESSRPANQELTLRLLTALKLNDEAKTILGFLLAGQRPFTTSELRTLYSIDVQKVALDKRANIPDVLRSLRQLVYVHEDIVRIRHRTIHHSIKAAIDQGKFPVPVKDGQTDLLLRTLAYSKLSLGEKYEPTLDDFDQNLLTRLFNRNVLLEYSVRYWTFHLKQSPIFPKQPSTKFQLTPELQKVFPDNVILPILEWLCWEAEISTHQALDLHLLISSLRSQILPETSLSILQTYIIISTYYTTFSQTTDAIKYYYLSSKICQTTLSDVHPLTIDICLRFLKITETLKFTKRTEIVKYKEEVLQVIISSYTKQYGSTSELVIKYETALAELYVSIQEEERAREIFLRLRKVTVEHYGENSDEARGVSDHLTIVLRRDIVTKDIDEYEDNIFLDQDEHDEVETFTLEKIDVLLRRAELYVSKKEWYKAEQTYIELWQQVSSRSRTTRAIEWHRKNIEVTHKYSKFLHSQKRETETTAVLICLWQEYEHHELTRSQELVEQLTEVARFLKTVNQHTVALSILKYASSYYKSVRKQESKIFTEIEEEIAITSTEVVKQSLSKTTTTTEITNTVSRSTFQSVFRSMISNKTKTVDKTTIDLARKLTTTYIEEQKYTEAISIIHSTFARIWSSFLHESIQTVTLTTSFLEESIELVEQLAESHLKLRQLEKVEDVYLRLFQAVLTSTSPAEPLFGKSRTILVSFYDKYGFPDKAIKVIQEVLVVSKKVLGSSHKLTIEILYDLGVRCRNHARNHPYWPDYYQQIITILNKDSDVCHHDAMNALIIVGTYYWEDRRYAEAVQMYSVLWATFVKKTKEYKHFSDTKFVMETYERYFQCLEETRVELDVLHKVASQYRETSVKTFGATATITTEATLSLARVSQRSEKHSSEAISLYEELTKTSSVSTTKITQIKEELLTLYTREITSKKSSTVKKESIDRAISIYNEQLVEHTSKYGYSEISTLTVLRELLRFYARQEKKEQIIKEIHTAVVSIVSKETHSQKLIESASYLAETISILHLEEHSQLLIEELHSQVIAKHRHSTKTFSFDLTKTSRSALVFIAGLEFYIRKDLQITFSEIMSGLLSEAFYYDNFYRLIQANDALDKILIAAAPLRTFLLRRGLKIMVEHVENETIELFRKRDTAKLALRSQNSPRLFIVVILQHLGRKKSSNFINSVITASNENVLSLTKAQQFNEAYDVANCAFLFAKAHDGYSAPRAISQGFKLALLLAGRGGAASCKDQEIRKVLLQLSNRVIRDILEICKSKEINFAKVHLTELNQLVALLGDQEDWVNLEWLLSALWTTREAQRTWPGHVLLKLGRNLIMARYLSKQLVKAIRLAEDISYNLRRVHGLRHPATLETYQLLTQLYTSAGQQYNAGSGKSGKSLAQQYFRKAFLLHEELLKMLVYEGTNEDEDDDELDSTAAILSQHGVSVNGSVANGGSDDGYNQELELSQMFDQDAFLQENLRHMKLAYQRLGAFPKRTDEYTRLNKDLFARFGKSLEGVEGVEKWSAKSYGGGKAESEDGAFVKPAKWEFADSVTP